MFVLNLTLNSSYSITVGQNAKNEYFLCSRPSTINSAVITMLNSYIAITGTGITVAKSKIIRCSFCILIVYLDNILLLDFKMIDLSFCFYII
jgi:hypothetical protein